MAARLTGRFASRKPAGEKPASRITPAFILITAAVCVFLVNAAGLVPAFGFNPLAEAVIYALFFAAVFLNEKAREPLGDKFHHRALYALFLVFLTVAGLAGGITSGLKWAPLIPAAAFAFNRDYRNASVLAAGSFLGFIRSVASYTPGDYFLYLSLFLGALLFHFTTKPAHKEAQGALEKIETQKESKHFKTVIYGLLESVLRLYHDILGPVSIILFLRDEEGNLAHTISVSKREKLVDRYYSFGVKEGVVGAGLAKGTFFTFDARGVKMPYYTDKVPVVSAATVPVVLNKMIGGIALDFERDIEPEKEAVKQRLKNLTEEVVGIMELFDINHKVISKERRVSALYEINGKLNLMDGKSGLIRKFFEEARAFDVYSGYLAEYLPEENAFAITEPFNYPSSVAGTRFSARDNEILRYCLDSGKPVVVEDAAKKNISLNMKRMNIESTLVSVLRNGDHVYGFIKLDKEKGYAFNDFEVKTIEMIISRITIMLENASLYEKVKFQAFHDGLTGLLNHLTFQERLRESIEKQRKGAIKCVSLCVLDIDFFKKFNDSFGHQEGDRVLMRMAGALREFEKKVQGSYCARYGGEEFVFVMEDSDIYAAMDAAEQIRAYSEANLKGGNEKEKRPITLSIGVTSYPDYAKEGREMFKNADDALYLAKQEGRNRVKSIVDVRKTDRRKR